MNNELGTEKIGRLLVKYSIPNTVAMVFIALYNMVDQIFIGWGVGYLGNACTNIIFPINQVAMAFGMMIGDGTAAFVNLRRGAGEEREAEKGIISGLFAAVSVGVILTVLLEIFLSPLCRLFGATDALMPYALDYGHIIVAGLFISVFCYYSTTIIRANGAPGFAMLGLIISTIINAIGDPIAIFVFGWGVKGAAIATVFAQAVHAVMNIIFLSRRIKLSWFTRENLAVNMKCMIHCAYLGLSSFVSNIAMVVGLFVQNNLFVHYGALSKYGAEIPLAAFGISIKVFSIISNMVIGLVGGAQVLLSYNYGAKNYRRVKETIKRLIIVTFILLAIATFAFQVFPRQLLSIFGITDELYMEFAVKSLRIFLAFLVVDTCQMTISPILQAFGKTISSTVFVMMRQLISMMIGLILFGYLFGVEGLLLSGPFSSLTVGIAALIVMIVQWKKLTKLEKEHEEGTAV